MKRFTSVRLAIGGFLLFTVLLFLYSFTQIDLSLTLSQTSVFQTVQKGFQYIGYFNRPLSAQLYFFIIIGLFFFYIVILDGIRKKYFTLKHLVPVIIGTTLLLMAAYNAFSYDLFNYIFDAKIVTEYGDNPYLKKALDYPTDPMLSFMRWTHRTYPYGPVWLGMSVPLSYLGMQIFTVTFALFKLFMAGAFLGTVYFLYKTLKEIKPENAVFGTAFFALNPLVLIESVVSSHNDIVMLFLAMVSIYLLVRKRFLFAYLFLILSVGVKFGTLSLLPAFMYVHYLSVVKKKIPWERVFGFMLLLSIGAVVAATLRTNFQPWYVLYLMPIAALLSHRKYIVSAVTLISVTSLFNYLPFLFFGNWDPPIPFILNNLNLTSVVVAVMMFLILFKQEKNNSK